MAAESPIRIDFDLSGFSPAIESAVRDELPFAFALALTRIGSVARSGVKADMASHFTIRHPFVSQNIKLDPARVPKGTMTVDLGSKLNKGNTLMELEALGGTGHGKRGRGVWVPTDTFRGAKTNLIPKGKKPTALLRGKQFESLQSGQRLRGQGMFFMRKSDGGNGIMHREAGKAGAIVKEWSFHEAVKIPSLWPFWADVQRAVGENWPNIAAAALAQALKSRKS